MPVRCKNWERVQKQFVVQCVNLKDPLISKHIPLLGKVGLELVRIQQSPFQWQNVIVLVGILTNGMLNAILVTFYAIIYFQWQNVILWNVILLVGILLNIILSSVFQLNVLAPFYSYDILCNDVLSMAECHFVGWHSSKCFSVKFLSAECCSSIFILCHFV